MLPRNKNRNSRKKRLLKVLVDKPNIDIVVRMTLGLGLEQGKGKECLRNRCA
jgi:hypothetical protein